MSGIGVSLPFFNTAATTLLQEKVEPAYLGRVFSIMNMINSSMMPMGMLFFGPLADTVAIEWLLIVAGIGNILAALLLLRDKPLLAAGLRAIAESSD
jgi:DHA3 family macrolide efflux protein-like MFS transporter